MGARGRGGVWTRGMALAAFPALALALAVVAASCASAEERLWEATKAGDVAAVTALLDDGVQPNARTPDDETALWLITDVEPVTPEHLEVARLLLQRGASPDVKCKPGGNRPLINWAVTRRAAGLVDVLVEANVDLEAEDIHGHTPLVIVAQNTQDLPMLDRLLAAGAKVEHADGRKRTPLLHAVEKKWRPGVERLVKAEALADARDKWGVTPMMAALRRKSPELAAVLLAANPPDGYALHADVWIAAVEGDQVDALRGTLAELQAIPAPGPEPSPVGPTGRAETPAGNTALMVAAAFGSVQQVREALTAGVRVNEANGHGYNALMLAAAQGRLEHVKVLVEAGATLKQIDQVRRDVFAVVKARQVGLGRNAEPAKLAAYAAIVTTLEATRRAHKRAVVAAHRAETARRVAMQPAEDPAPARRSTARRSIRKGSVGSRTRWSSGTYRVGK